jgi:hypothetical protein
MKLSEMQKSGIKAYQFSAHSILSNNKGIALVMVLVLSLISLVIMSGLIYMVTSGTQVSGIEKRYSTALEAGKGGGRDIVYQVLSARGNPYTAAEAALVNFNITAPGTCLTEKLNNATFINGVFNWNIACDSSPIIIPSTPSTYDMAFQLGNNPTYTAYVKIIDTVEGNSGADEGLIKSGVVVSNSGEVAVMDIPYLYTMEIDTENTNNPMERAKLSVLYQY